MKMSFIMNNCNKKTKSMYMVNWLLKPLSCKGYFVMLMEIGKWNTRMLLML